MKAQVYLGTLAVHAVRTLLTRLTHAGQFVVAAPLALALVDGCRLHADSTSQTSAPKINTLRDGKLNLTQPYRKPNLSLP